MLKLHATERKRDREKKRRRRMKHSRAFTLHTPTGLACWGLLNTVTGCDGEPGGGVGACAAAVTGDGDFADGDGCKAAVGDVDGGR